MKTCGNSLQITSIFLEKKEASSAESEDLGSGDKYSRFTSKFSNLYYEWNVQKKVYFIFYNSI